MTVPEPWDMGWMEIWTQISQFVTPASYVHIVHMQLSYLGAEPVLAAMLDTKQRKPWLAGTHSKGPASCPFSSHLLTCHPDGHRVAGWPRISVWGNSIRPFSKMTEHFSRMRPGAPYAPQQWSVAKRCLHFSVSPSRVLAGVVRCPCLLRILCTEMQPN